MARTPGEWTVWMQPSAVMLVAFAMLIMFVLVHRRRRQRGKKKPFCSCKFGGAELDDSQVRAYVGVGLCLGSLSSPVWVVLPVLLDNKLAQDPDLLGLTEETLTITTTAIFIGWVVGCLFLPRLLQVFHHAQLLVGSICGLLLVALATVTLPHLTAGNLWVFTVVRFIHGIFLNMHFLQILYVQEAMPEGYGIPALISVNVGFCCMEILQAYLCGGPMFDWDWRLQAGLLYSLGLVLCLCIGFPNWWDILCSIPKSSRRLFDSDRKVPLTPSAALSTQEWTYGLSLASAFLATGCAFWGLNYSVGQLSTNKYRSMMFFSAADILGYSSALTAAAYGRSRAQALAFCLAALCLFFCSTCERGSFFMMSSAMVGRICLDLCWNTIYVFGEIFSPTARRKVLSACEITIRIGTTLAPYMGTLPASISCKFFGFLCLFAGLASLHLPDAVASKQLSPRNQGRDHFGLLHVA